VEKWHNKNIEQVEKALETQLLTGLSKTVASSRLQEFGTNELIGKKKRTLVVMFFDQFKNVLVLILIAAALISGGVERVFGRFCYLRYRYFERCPGSYTRTESGKIVRSLETSCRACGAGGKRRQVDYASDA